MEKTRLKLVNKIFIFAILLLLVFSGVFLTGCVKNDDNENKEDNNSSFQVLNLDKPLGVWWWDKTLSDEYLTFAKLNGVDEIYYCDYSPQEDVYNFVLKAKQKGIKVYLLLGEKEWVNDVSNLNDIINLYKIYQQTYSDAKLSGIHLDVEPHQFSDFKYSEDTRKNYITKFINMASNVVKSNSDITFDFDIPFWFSDEVEFDGQTKSAYKHLIDIASRVFVMSYRDSAQEVVRVARDEVDYAKTNGKQIFVSVEMASSEGDNVSFQEESKQVLNEQLNKLENFIGYDNYGVSIHHIKTWKNLKDK